MNSPWSELCNRRIEVRKFTSSALLLALTIPGCSDDGPSGLDAREMAEMMSGDTTMELDEDDLENFIAAMTDLKKVGADLESQTDDGPGDVKQFMNAMGARAEFLEVFDDHDLSQLEFFKIQTNVMKAFAALQSEALGGSLGKGLQGQLESLDAMKANLPPEARARMEEGLEAAKSQMASFMADIPEANLELVRKYMDQLKAALR